MTLHNSLSNTSNETRISFDLRYNPIGQSTGRGAFPGFIARSRQNPNSELRDADEWSRLWVEAREKLADSAYDKPINLWSADAPVRA